MSGLRGARNGSRRLIVPGIRGPASRRPLGLRSPLPQLAGGEREHLADGVVEGADGGEPGGEGHVAHRQLGGLDEQPCRLGALRPGQGQRPGAELGAELPFDLAGRVAEPGGETGHALAVDDPVLDEPHGAGHGVGPGVPLGEPGLVSGRQRLQALNPACWQAAALGRKVMFRALGGTAGQLVEQ